jgi:type I restriction enzyme S subunit
MSEWKTYTLGKDVVTKLGDGLHGTPIYDENGEYYFINGSNLVDGKIVINSNTKKVTEEEFLKYKKDLSDKTILLGINGTIGNIALYNDELCILGKSAAYLNINNDFDKQFIRYVLTNDHFQNYIKNNASGTTIKNVGLGLLREYEFSAPEDKAKQQEIAQILTSLDDKIELNLQMNQTLEAMAQTLFKEWFVNFNFPEFNGELENGLPKGWRMTKLSEIIEIKHGYAFKGEFFSDSEEKDILVTPGNFKIGGGFNSQKFKYYKGDIPNDYILNRNDLIVTMTDLSKAGDTLGYSALVPTIDGKRLLHNQRIGKVVFKSDLPVNYFLYWLMRQDDYRHFVLGGATGSTVKHTSPTRICEFEFPLPSEELLSKFETKIKSLSEKAQENEIQINTLTQTRDAILPKLMSGELIV